MASMSDNNTTCAACGKEGDGDNMNICNKCKTAKYCNATCKKKHRNKHKKACDKRVAELYEEATSAAGRMSNMHVRLHTKSLRTDPDLLDTREKYGSSLTL